MTNFLNKYMFFFIFINKFQYNILDFIKIFNIFFNIISKFNKYIYFYLYIVYLNIKYNTHLSY